MVPTITRAASRDTAAPPTALGYQTDMTAPTSEEHPLATSRNTEPAERPQGA